MARSRWPLYKFWWYSRQLAEYMMPRSYYRRRLARWLQANGLPSQELAQRAAYYCQPRASSRLSTKPTSIRDFKFPLGQRQRHSGPFFDLYSVLRYFDGGLRFDYFLTDLAQELPTLGFAKSRPIGLEGSNTVLLNLDSLRHFHFIEDRRPYASKCDQLVSRSVARQPHRRQFLEACFGSPLCDVGQVNRDTNCDHPEWVKPYMPEAAQLNYKFIACIQGNDVSTNLKWVLASNSLAVMPHPTVESWFMEGTLRGGVHYVEVKADFSDVQTQIAYYLAHPREAEAIIERAHAHVAQFANPRLERAIALKVAANYFLASGQQLEL